MSGETIEGLYIPHLGAVRYNESNRDIEVGIDGAWVPIWRIGNIQQLPMSVVMQIGRIAGEQTPETLSYRSVITLGTLGGALTDPNDLVNFPQEESCSSSASSTGSSGSSSSLYEAPDHCRHNPRCVCNLCTEIRDLSRREIARRQRERESKDLKIEKIKNEYQSGKVGKYDNYVSYSKSRKLMLP